MKCESTGKNVVNSLYLPNFNYDANTVSELKIMFPHNIDLHSALDANDVSAWDMVLCKV